MKCAISKISVDLFVGFLVLASISYAQNKDSQYSAGVDPKSPGEQILGEKGGSNSSQEQGYKAKLTIPIFGQIVVFSFPKGFTPISEKKNNFQYLQESVLAGESGDQWTQMITVTGLKGASSNEKLTPEIYADLFADLFKRACPTSFSLTKLTDVKIDGYKASSMMVSCGEVIQSKVPSYSESTLLVVIKGEVDYYTIQWAERGSPSRVPIKYDESKWKHRLKSLAPINLCPNPPGQPIIGVDCTAKSRQTP
jgi:hypothetical protein